MPECARTCLFCEALVKVWVLTVLIAVALEGENWIKAASSSDMHEVKQPSREEGSRQYVEGGGRFDVMDDAKFMF
jgi:hypothetical protein